MKKDWFEKKVKKYVANRGYQKPEQIHDSLKLDSNENYAIPKQFQHDIILHAQKNADVREYPLGGTERLISAIAKFTRMPSSMIGVGNGSDQILDLLLANFATSKTKILTSDPTFGFFEERCKIYSIPLKRIPFSSKMKLDVGRFMEEAKNSNILYLDSPNNPTGFQFSKAELQKMVKTFSGMIIIDEAYGQFGDHSVSALARSQDNLIVVHTLSKSFGLAGLRLGYFVANKQFVDVFNRVLQYPYPLSTITIEAGILALKNASQMRKSVEVIKSERRRITEGLRQYDAFEVFDSKANFVLFDARGSYRRVFTALAEQGIAIRQLGKIGNHKGCLRVTIGTKEMNSKFLLAIRDLLR